MAGDGSFGFVVLGSEIFLVGEWVVWFEGTFFSHGLLILDFVLAVFLFCFCSFLAMD